MNRGARHVGVRRMRTTAGTLLVGILAAACSANSQAGEGEMPDLVGCYQFEWNETARELGLPWGFELEAAPLEGWGNLPDARVAATWESADTRMDHPFRYWREVGDTVQVGHPGGGGFALSLRADGRALVGTARPVGDAVAFGESMEAREPGPVTAQRVVCPAG